VLDLDSAEWGNLRHAYGRASDVPVMIRALEQREPPDDADVWPALYAALQHQGSVAPAAYAAVPHLARLAHNGGLRRRVDVLLFVEELAVRPLGFAPAALRVDYLAALGELRPMAVDVARAAANVSSYDAVLPAYYLAMLPCLIAACVALHAGPVPGLASFDALGDGTLYGDCPSCGRSVTLRLSLDSVDEDEGSDARTPSGRRLTPQRILSPSAMSERLGDARRLLSTTRDAEPWAELALPVAAALSEELGQRALFAAILQLDTVIACGRCGAGARVLDHDSRARDCA
jgi:hypothetical protein